MNRDNFLRELDELLELPSGTLKGPESLDGLNWDSMAMVSFIALADEHFGFSISPREFSKCHTVDDLIALIKPLAA